MNITKRIFLLFSSLIAIFYKAQVPCNSSNSPTFQMVTSQATLATYGICGLNVNILNATTIPPGGPLSFSLIAPGTSTSITIPSPIILTTTGTWTVLVKDLTNFCSSSQTVQVNVLSAPSVSIASSTTAMCLGSSVILTASGANSYTWSTSATTASITVSPATTSSYNVIATGSNVCANSASSTVNVYYLPNVNITASQNSICLNESVTFTASGASTYTWNNSQTGNTIAVTPTITSSYTVVGADQNGCKAKSYITMYVMPCTGLLQLKTKGEELKIYPVPTKDELYLSVFNEELLKEFHFLSIYNNLGVLIREEEIAQNKSRLNINTQDLPSGVYSLQLKGHAKETISKRFVIAR